MIKITYILSNINKALAFEWIANELDRSRFALSFILLNPGKSLLEEYLITYKANVHTIFYKGKNDLPITIAKLYKILRKEETEIVHCHLFDACIAGLIASRLARVKKRIYTRHHATFHQIYFPRAVWYDKFISNMASDVVAVSQNVQNTLIGEGINPKKVHLIHHGFKLEHFEHVDKAHIRLLNAKYNPFGKFPVIGVISRYFELKGIQYIIPAFAKLLDSYPNALLILANATGNYTPQIKLLLQNIPQESYVEISFETDLFALYQVFNIFIHVPIDSSIEAFGQTYVEALAAGVPSIFTLSGVANEFIKHHKNAWVVPFKDSEAIYKIMQEILTNSALKEKIVEQGRQDVRQRFTLQKMIKSLETLYAH